MSTEIAKNTPSAQEIAENLPNELPQVHFGTPTFLLPPWLQENIPHAFSPCRMIRHDPEVGKFIVDEDDTHYDSLEQAYDAHRGSKDYEINIAEDALIAEGLDPDFPMVILKNGRYLSTWMEKDELDLLQSHYDTAVLRVLNWLKDPKDYESSYSMLRSHPAFWTMYDEKPSFRWGDGNHILQFRHSLSREGMSMTTEVADQQTRSKYVPDERLSVTGDTFEECIVLMAALVNQYYTIEGYAR